jgi:chlorophyll/bacteriochlorophyll a synthase
LLFQKNAHFLLLFLHFLFFSSLPTHPQPNQKNREITILTMLYSIAGLGIAIVNDFKSIEGDRAMGLRSLPVEFGVDVAKWITVGTIDVTQVAVAAYLAFGLEEPVYGAVLLALILPQVYAQFAFFLKDPIKNDVAYQARAQPFLVFGLLATGLAIGHHNAAIGL